MSSNATLLSPAIDNPTQVSYKHRGSGNNKELIVEKSTDGGSTWTEIGVSKEKIKEHLKETESRWAPMAVVH